MLATKELLLIIFLLDYTQFVLYLQLLHKIINDLAEKWLILLLKINI